MGPELSVISASIVIMAVIIGCAKIMPPNDPEYAVKQTGEAPKVSGGEGLVAAMPFILIFVLLLLTSNCSLQSMVHLRPLKHLYRFIKVLVQNLIHSVWIATPGIMIFIAGIVGGFIQKAKLRGNLRYIG